MRFNIALIVLGMGLGAAGVFMGWGGLFPIACGIVVVAIGAYGVLTDE